MSETDDKIIAKIYEHFWENPDISAKGLLRLGRTARKQI